MKKRILIICIGNEIRSDDGAAIHLARELEKLKFPEIEVITTHQLIPELADTISQFDLVIFVDASVETNKNIKLIKIEKNENQSEISTFHSISPEILINLSEKLYNKKIEAYALKIPAINFEFSTKLHPHTKQKMFEAIDTLINFLNCIKNGTQNETTTS
jgi:hydrogenase maturation protease